MMPTASGASPTARRVLVVDDNRDSVETLSMLLRVKGHETRVAANGEEAMALADEHRPDVVILDLSLPGMDGYEVAERLRQRSYGRELILVALTGWSGQGVQAKAARAGFDFHMLKPVDWAQLEQVLEAKPQAT